MAHPKKFYVCSLRCEAQVYQAGVALRCMNGDSGEVCGVRLCWLHLSVARDKGVVLVNGTVLHDGWLTKEQERVRKLESKSKRKKRLLGVKHIA